MGMFKKWKSRYFTLSGDKLTYKDTTISTGVEQPTSMTITQTLDVGSIRSVKVASKKNIPKAFEIFTDDRSFVLKAKDNSKAQEWIQCLSVARAHTQAKDSNLKNWHMVDHWEDLITITDDHLFTIVHLIITWQL